METSEKFEHPQTPVAVEAPLMPEASTSESLSMPKVMQGASTPEVPRVPSTLATPLSPWQAQASLSNPLETLLGESPPLQDVYTPKSPIRDGGDSRDLFFSTSSSEESHLQASLQGEAAQQAPEKSTSCQNLKRRIEEARDKVNLTKLKKEKRTLEVEAEENLKIQAYQQSDSFTEDREEQSTPAISGTSSLESEEIRTVLTSLEWTTANISKYQGLVGELAKTFKIETEKIEGETDLFYNWYYIQYAAHCVIRWYTMV